MAWLRKNWFLLGICAALLAGYLAADRALALNPGGWTHKVCVFLLFLITGIKLPTDRIASDLVTPRLHIFIQLFIFAVPPLVFLAATPLFDGFLGGDLLVGVYALAVLPTTVSSCIVFTQSAGGNVVAAIFNAALANTVGIFLSPLLLSVMLSTGTESLPLGQLLATLRDLAINMLLPIAAGQLLRTFLRDFAEKRSRMLSEASSGLLLLILFLAIARTAANPDFASNAAELPLPLLYLGAAHILFVLLVLAIGKAIRLSRSDLITALFVAPQKTLALGAPLLTIYFAGREILGVALLPLIFYHPFQLLVAGFMKGLPFMRAREDAAPAVPRGADHGSGEDR